MTRRPSPFHGRTSFGATSSRAAWLGALVLCAASLVTTSCAPAEPPGAAESNVSAAVRRERATLIRDTASAAGITNGLMIAMLAEEETYLSHCASEFPACPGPASSDCGGSAVISGGGDGACSLNRGGLGMFQIDDGTESDTVRVHGAGVLTLRGNTQVAIERLIQKTMRSRYLTGTATRAQAIAFINALRIDDGSWGNWIRTLVRYWNGCPEGGRCWSNRYPKYDTAARTLYREMGHAFWYGGEPTTPPPAGSGWLSSPLESTRVTSHVSNRRGSGWVRYDCVSLSRANHRGTDFGVAVGTPVYAAAAGTVIRSVTGCPANGSMSSTCGGGFGNHVILLHDGGFATLYAHMSAGGGQARHGARVACGDVIGNSGNSGRTTGPHLHFEVRSNVRDVASYYASTARTLDPYGGACSTQTEALWLGGAPTRSCTPPGERDDAVITRSTYPSEVRSAPGTRLTQALTWRNTGSTTWTSEGYAMRHTGGAFGAPAEIRLPGGTMVAPGGTIEVRVEVTVPSTAGLHIGRWRMARVGGAPFGREATLRVRVASAPRACSSATLGTTVSNGECVQVSYPGCGAESCAWYRCSDGSWYCTDSAACTGESHPNDACGGPPESDGGVPGGECSGGGTGQPIHGACETPDDCCDGLDCGGSLAGGSECCTAAEEPCGRHSDCCGEMLCTSGFCGCVPENQLCIEDSECCEGLACLSGACRDVTGCTREGDGCGSAAECCYPLRCNASGVGEGTTCCISGGQRCRADDDCCGEMLCTGGRCASRQLGESCASVLDCYGSLLCLDDRCGAF